jgi:microbial collagenase
VTFRIYGTKKDYQTYQSLLYGLSSSNGGIYIENGATVYTFERTPQESSYTLTSLVRHEYAHYLVGRYIVPGLWGGAPIYSGGRLIFFDEGLAEFFSGATRTDGIVTLATTRKLLPMLADRVALGEVPELNYNSSGLYPQAGALFFYLYTAGKVEQIQAMTNAAALVGINAVQPFDDAVNAMVSAPGAAAAYAAFLADLAAGTIETRTPGAAPYPPIDLANEASASVASELSARSGTPVQCRPYRRAPYDVTYCTGALAAGSSWAARNEAVDQFLTPVAGESAAFPWMRCAFQLDRFACELPHPGASEVDVPEFYTVE